MAKGMEQTCCVGAGWLQVCMLPSPGSGQQCCRGWPVVVPSVLTYQVLGVQYHFRLRPSRPRRTGRQVAVDQGGVVVGLALSGVSAVGLRLVATMDVERVKGPFEQRPLQQLLLLRGCLVGSWGQRYAASPMVSLLVPGAQV